MNKKVMGHELLEVRKPTQYEEETKSFMPWVEGITFATMFIGILMILGLVL